MRAALYLRVSTLDQHPESQGLKPSRELSHGFLLRISHISQWLHAVAAIKTVAQVTGRVIANDNRAHTPADLATSLAYSEDRQAKAGESITGSDS